MLLTEWSILGLKCQQSLAFLLLGFENLHSCNLCFHSALSQRHSQSLSDLAQKWTKKRTSKKWNRLPPLPIPRFQGTLFWMLMHELHLLKCTIVPRSFFIIFLFIIAHRYQYHADLAKTLNQQEQPNGVTGEQASVSSPDERCLNVWTLWCPGLFY